MGQRTYESGEITRSEILQKNEKIKAWSGIGVNFGTAFVIAGAARWFYKGFDQHVLLWLILGPMFIWSAVSALAFLEVGDQK